MNKDIWNVRIKPSKLTGSIDAISSKSYAHRALIFASLGVEESVVYFNKSSNDIDVTIACLRELGASIERTAYGARVSPIVKKEGPVRLNCGESGSTLRFLLPLAAAIYEECEFEGEGRLPERTIAEIVEVMKENGVAFDRESLPLKTSGLFSYDHCYIRGDISSQYISGLLMAGAYLKKECEIHLTTQLYSKGYVDLTLEIMREFGIEVQEDENSYLVMPSELVSRDLKVEGDWSNSSFFLVAGALGQGIGLRGLKMDSSQGDREIVSTLQDFGAQISIEDGEIRVEAKSRRLVEVDVSQIPDMVPILAVLAASVQGGKSKFTNAGRLRDKESDRLTSTSQMINNLGGKVIEKPDSIEVIGTGGLSGGQVDSFNDHRIVMAATIASVISQGEIKIINAKAVEKSYPDFFEDFGHLGGQYEI